MPHSVRERCIPLLLAVTLCVSISVSAGAANTVTPANTVTSYTVQPGDTLYAIGKKFGVSVNQLAQLNNLRDPSAIKPGMKLVLKASETTKTESVTNSQKAAPTTASTPSNQAATSVKTYTVQRGDTLWGISRKTGVAVNEILTLNGLRTDTVLHPGDILRLASGQQGAASKDAGVAAPAQVAIPNTTNKETEQKLVAVPALPMPVPQVITPIGGMVVPVPLPSNGTQITTKITEGKTAATQETPTQKADAQPKADGSAVEIPKVSGESSTNVASHAVSTDADRAREALGRLNGSFPDNVAWPVTGRLTSKFGKRWGRSHEGIDLAVPIGTPVRVASDGLVTYSGWFSGYGYLVIVDHGDGWETYYGHNSELRAKVGTKVLRGDVIARSGNTGNTTGPHVHFEVRQNGTPVDPLRFLK